MNDLEHSQHVVKDSCIVNVRELKGLQTRNVFESEKSSVTFLRPICMLSISDAHIGIVVSQEETDSDPFSFRKGLSCELGLHSRRQTAQWYGLRSEPRHQTEYWL